ncbi:hypothetical protein Tco_1232089 [Tanacetum coccineum]
MADLTFADSHNMVAYLEKSEANADFAEIVDFLNASPIRYALTVSPTIYVSYIEQFWSTTKTKTVNNETQIRAKVKPKTIVITESSVRRDLHFDDEDGITCLTNTKIFENLQLMGYEKLSDKLTFLKPFFSPQWKYLIHTILQCLSSKSTAWNEFGTNIASAVICLAKKQKFNFSKLIFDGQPTKPQHTPTTASPSHVEPIPTVASLSHPKKTHKRRKTKSKVTKIPKSNEPTNLDEDEVVHEERGDNVERAATTAASLDAEQNSEAMGDTIAQTRSKRVSTPSYDSPLLGVNTPRSDEERIKLKELMDMCTKLSDRVLDFENVKDVKALKIKKLKKRVKKLERKNKSRTPQPKRRVYKPRVESSEESLEVVLEEESIELVEDKGSAKKGVSAAKDKDSTADLVTTADDTVTPASVNPDDVTLAETLMAIKSSVSRPQKLKGVLFKETREPTTITTSRPQP